MAECSQRPACPPCPPRSGPTPLVQEEKQQEAGSPVLVWELVQAPVRPLPAPVPKIGEGLGNNETGRVKQLSLFSH